MANHTHQKNLDSYFLGHPKPLFSLFFTELWERFSFYGIRPLLVLYMVATLGNNGLGLDRQTASAIVGIFGGFIYLAPLGGGWLADNWLGQKKATLYGAGLMALGHLSIALSAWFGLSFFFLGLSLIVFGTGLFKTCISVIVGMLYKEGDSRRDSGFLIFYMGVNMGAFIAPLITGVLQEHYGWHLGFGIGGVGMLLSLLIFYFKAMKDLDEFALNYGIKQSWEQPQNPKKAGLLLGIFFTLFGIIFVCMSLGIIVINPQSIAKNMLTFIIVFVSGYFIYLMFFANLTAQERKNLLILLVLLISASVFWSTFEQQSLSFNLFANDYINRHLLGFEIPSVWFQSINPLFIIIFAPIIGSFWVYLSKKGVEISSFLKFALGLFLTGVGYIVMICASNVVLSNNGAPVSMLWLILAYFFITIGELWLSPVGLSIMTQIAPEKIKGQTMGLWFISVALGNVVAGLYGGEVRADNLANLPSIFSQLTFILFGAGCVLVVLYLVLKGKKINI